MGGVAAGADGEAATDVDCEAAGAGFALSMFDCGPLLFQILDRQLSLCVRA